MNVTTSATMFHMGEDCLLEDLTLNMFCNTTNDNITLKGIVFDGTSSQTSRLRKVDISIDNITVTSDVIGVEFLGIANSNYFSSNSIKNSVIHIYSNGGKRGILVSGSNMVSVRETNVYVHKPTNLISVGSYVGIETNDISNNGSIQLRNCTIGVVLPSNDA